ncbi:hypothetical protein PJN90_29130, partial [Mycobacterium kansasii]
PSGPQLPGGPPTWNQGGPPSGGKRTPWALVAGAAALGVVVIVAGVGIWLATRKGDDTPVADTTTTSATTSSGKPTTTKSSPATTTPGGD